MGKQYNRRIQVTTNLPPVLVGEADFWADYDKDGDLDVLITGTTTVVPTSLNCGETMAAIPLPTLTLG